MGRSPLLRGVPALDGLTDIRDVLRVPGVNLIYRHFATVPGCLPWVWSHLKDLFNDQALVARVANVSAESAGRLPDEPVG